MKIDIHHSGLESHKRLIESEIRELSALQQELERLIRLVDRSPEGDSRQLRKSRDCVGDLISSARRRLEFLTRLPSLFRETGEVNIQDISEMSSILFDE